MSAESSRLDSKTINEVDESTALLAQDRTKYTGERNEQQDEENDPVSAPEAAAEEGHTKDDEPAAPKVSPTAVVLVLVVGMFFSRVRYSSIWETGS
jgi:nucleoid-associated protein YgaU